VTRGTKYFLLAIAAAAVAWAIGTIAIGYAEIRYFTSSGAVDMLNATAISVALSDPSFTATLTWGGFTLKGIHWTFSLPLLLAAITFVSVLVVAKARGRRAAP
jgi:hypothetical protein